MHSIALLFRPAAAFTAPGRRATGPSATSIEGCIQVHCRILLLIAA